MKTIKVIDLLNKIANGEEVPKKFRYIDYIYELTESYFKYDYRNKDNKIFENVVVLERLNDEVEIIEDTPEKNNIKEIFALNTDSYAEDVYYEKLSKEEICLDIQTLKHKINEIIDKINGE